MEDIADEQAELNRVQEDDFIQVADETVVRPTSVFSRNDPSAKVPSFASGV